MLGLTGLGDESAVAASEGGPLAVAWHVAGEYFSASVRQLVGVLPRKRAGAGRRVLLCKGTGIEFAVGELRP